MHVLDLLPTLQACPLQHTKTLMAPTAQQEPPLTSISKTHPHCFRCWSPWPTSTCLPPLAKQTCCSVHWQMLFSSILPWQLQRLHLQQVSVYVCVCVCVYVCVCVVVCVRVWLNVCVGG